MTWLNGDGTPDTSMNQAEDPLMVASQEMAATIAVHAQQKAELSKAGLGGLVGGGMPSAAAIQQSLRGQNADPYAGLSRDEKIALIGQIQKSRQQAVSDPSVESPHDMVDPTTYLVGENPQQAAVELPAFEAPLEKGGTGEGSRGGKVVGHTASGKPEYEASHIDQQHRTEHGVYHIVGQPKRGLAVTYTRHGETAKKHIHTDGEEGAPSKHPLHPDFGAALKAAKLHSRSQETDKSMEKSAEGEGSKGGHVIGHTASGKPVYAPSEELGELHYRCQRHGQQIRETQKHTKAHMDQHADFSKQDHKDAQKLHEKAQDYKDTSEAGKFRASGHDAAARAHEDAAYDMKKSFDASGLERFIQKEQKAAPMVKATDILNEFLSKAEGQGGMPESGVPASMPTTRRKVDGGDLTEVGKQTGAQSPAPATVSTTASAPSPGSADLRKTAKDSHAPDTDDEDLEDEAGGEKLQKGQWVDWNDAADDGVRQKAQMVSQFLNRDMDVTPSFDRVQKSAKPAEKDEQPTVWFQKGGSVAYIDSEDIAIEKALKGTTGTTFTQGGSMNRQAAIAQHQECPKCGSLVKSYLSSCTECGIPLHGGSRNDGPGLQMSKSVAQSLFSQDDLDVKIG